MLNGSLRPVNLRVTLCAGRFNWDDSFGDVFRSLAATAAALVAVGLAEPGAPIHRLPDTQTNLAFRAGDRFIKVYRQPFGGRREVAALNTGLGELLAVYAETEVYAIATPWLAALDAWTALARGHAVDFVEIGAALASTHQHLAQLGVAEISGAELVERFHQRIVQARQLVPELTAELAALARLAEPVSAQTYLGHRIHGDFHLGQVLLTAPPTIIDFEGEPGVELASIDSPLADLAGLLRSIAYAEEKIRPDLNVKQVTESVFYGYRRDTTQHQLLTMLYADRAVYELIYESQNRPEWVSIPWRAIAGLAAKEEPWHSILQAG